MIPLIPLPDCLLDRCRRCHMDATCTQGLTFEAPYMPRCPSRSPAVLDMPVGKLRSTNTTPEKQTIFYKQQGHMLPIACISNMEASALATQERRSHVAYCRDVRVDTHSACPCVIQSSQGTGCEQMLHQRFAPNIANAFRSYLDRMLASRRRIACRCLLTTNSKLYLVGALIYSNTIKHPISNDVRLHTRENPVGIRKHSIIEHNQTSHAQAVNSSTIANRFHVLAFNRA